MFENSRSSYPKSERTRGFLTLDKELVEKLRTTAAALAQKLEVDHNLECAMNVLTVTFMFELESADKAMALPPGLRRNLDENEFHSFFWLIQHKDDFKQPLPTILRKAQDRSNHGQITDPLQIFFDLGCLLPELKPLIPFIQSGVGHENLKFEVRDVGVAWTLMRVLQMYFEKVVGQTATLMEFGLSLNTQARLRVLFGRFLTTNMDMELALAAAFYDPDRIFSFELHGPLEEQGPPPFLVGGPESQLVSEAICLFEFVNFGILGDLLVPTPNDKIKRYKSERKSLSLIV